MKLITYLLCIPLLLIACAKYDFDDAGQLISDEEVSITFQISDIEQIPFDDSSLTRASGIESLCSRISFAVFRQDEKVKNINQTSGSDGFGSFTVALTPGSYRVVVIAHNGLGNATISTPEKITFANNKCTDTFYYYGEMEVSQTTTCNLSLKRAVAAFRMNITDAMPDNVTKMQFYYTGGSSTFDAVSGYGCVNSKQNETIEVTSAMKGKASEFQVYTFPHEMTGNLKMTVTALDASGQTVCEKVIDPVPVTVNKISRWEGKFFEESNEGRSAAFTLGIENNGEWGGIDNVN